MFYAYDETSFYMKLRQTLPVKNLDMSSYSVVFQFLFIKRHFMTK